MRLEVGGVYEYGALQQAVITYTCVALCEAETVRYKRKVPGYKILILAVKPPDWWTATPDNWEYAPGNVMTIPAGAHITVGVRRLD